MIIARRRGIHCGKAGGLDADLRKRCGIACADVDGGIGKIKAAVGRGVFDELLGLLIMLQRTAQVAVVNGQILQIAEGIKPQYDRLCSEQLLLMPLGIGLCAAQTGLLRTGEQYDNLRMFKADIRLRQRFERTHGHIAAGEVIVCTGNAFKRVLKKQKSDKTREQAEKDHAEHVKENVKPTGQFHTRHIDHEKLYKIGCATNDEADHRGDQDGLHAVAAEFIIQRPFILGIGMAYQENAAFDLTLRLAGGDHIMRRMAGKQRIDKLLIHHELQHQRDRAEEHQNQADERMVEPIEERSDDTHRHRKRDKAHKRLAVYCKFLDLHVVRPLLELLCHHLLRLKLLRAARRTRAHLFDNMFDLIAAILHGSFQVKSFSVCRLLCILQFSSLFL